MLKNWLLFDSKIYLENVNGIKEDYLSYCNEQHCFVCFKLFYKTYLALRLPFYKSSKRRLHATTCFTIHAVHKTIL